MNRTRSLWTFSTILALTAVLTLSTLHRIDSGLSRGIPLIGLLRDFALAMPLVALMTFLAARTAERLIRHMHASGPGALLLRATLLAAAGSAAMAVNSQPHQILFGTGGERHLPPVPEMARDGLLVFVPLLLTAVGLLVGQRIAAPSGRQRRAALAILASCALVATTSGPALAAPATGPISSALATATEPGSPCLVGAPQKTFDVQSLDVKIPLNRYGDNDPQGKMYALSSEIGKIRAEEASQQVSIGLRDDPIQPLVVRANLGDCVTFTYQNKATGGSYGIHIDGLSFLSSSSGDSVGNNVSSSPATDGTASYQFYIPNDPQLEGSHYLHPGPGNRFAVDHGLFGTLSVEPMGATYRNPSTGAEQVSGWEADILPGSGKSFREAVQILHEVGNDNETINDKFGNPIDVQDNTTGSYLPGSFALNYRSEPFKNRLIGHPTEKAHSYGSYTFGDPATPMPRGYLADPTKFRVLHAGGEKFHVYHLHGGGDRWRVNPHADATYNYANTGLQKDPATPESPSQRIDSQSMGPGEAYDLEIEGGAGGVQQSVGDFLYHCHIAKHYVSGMWSMWRVLGTQVPDLKPLPDRVQPPKPVDARGLIGRTMPDGTKLTAANLDSWIRPQLPPQGVPKNSQDAGVWNWTVDSSGNYLGEPEDLTLAPDSTQRYTDPAHPNRQPGDQMVGSRPKIMFDPTNGRPAYPLLRTHIGKRPPFTANGHSGAPYLGENANQAKSAVVNPLDKHVDGLCPSGRYLRKFNIVAIETAVPTSKTTVDPEGKLFVLAKNKDKVRGGQLPAEPLAIRSNQGDCVAITLTNEMTDADAFDHFSKVEMHIHHVQFDVQGSDGVTTGFAYEHSVRPYKVEDPTLSAAVAAGATTLHLSSTAKFQPREFIAVGEGTEAIDIVQIKSISGTTVTLAKPLARAHPAGEWAGMEFVQYRWYPDVVLDNVFWHDHVDGIHGWGHGLVGQLIVEPKGSTYHDPRTGAVVDSGALVDVHTTTPLAPGSVDGSFREQAIWTINDNDQDARSTINLRSEPLAGRNPATRFSSYVNGDPVTPLPRAYPGDKIVLRVLSVSPTLDTLHVQGVRFRTENRYVDADGPEAGLLDTVHHAISERTTLILDGGGGGSRHAPGDYLYFSGSETRQQQGAWGLIRVLPGQTPDLQPLPNNAAPAGSWSPPQDTSPPPTNDPGDPCPAGAPLRTFAISSIDVGKGASISAFVKTSEVALVRAGGKKVEPLVLHVAAGDCVQVNFHNARDPNLTDPTLPKSSFSISKLQRDVASSGVDAGYTSEQNVPPGGSRPYRYYVDSPKLGTATIADFGDSAKQGLYGALVVAPAGARFTDPVTGLATDIGSQVDVHTPGGYSYRDFTVDFADDDFTLGRDFMGYVTQADSKAATINYAAGRAGDGPNAFSTVGTPALRTPLLRAYPGDHMQVHALVAPGSEVGHVFSLGGLSWQTDQFVTGAQKVAAQGFGPWESIDANIVGGAGGWASKATGATGDLFYGDLRRPFTVAGQWGLQRILPRDSCVLVNLDGTSCGMAAIPPAAPTVTSISPSSGPVGMPVMITGTEFTGATTVTFGGVEAKVFNVSSDTKITATVPTGARSGPIGVTTPDGTGSGAAFTVSPPTITGFTPTSAVIGAAVTISGTNFTGATKVTFGLVSAAFTVTTSRQIRATVPRGAIVGRVRVTTPAGTAVSAGAFTPTP